MSFRAPLRDRNLLFAPRHDFFSLDAGGVERRERPGKRGGQTLLALLHSRISEEINSSVVGSKDKLAALAAVFGIKGNMAMLAATCDLIACYG